MKPSETPQVYTTSGWVKYGLCLHGWVGDRGEAIRCHDLVATYLDNHPDAAARYRADQQCHGESDCLRYVDVLKLAEAEA